MRGGNERASIEEPYALDLNLQALGDPERLNLGQDSRPRVFVPLCLIWEGKGVEHVGVRMPSMTRYAAFPIPAAGNNGYAAALHIIFQIIVSIWYSGTTRILTH